MAGILTTLSGAGTLGVASTATAALPYEQIVGSNTRVPNWKNTATSTTNRLETRRVTVTGGQTLAYFRLVYANYYAAAATEPAIPNSYSLEASIEIPSAPIPGPIRVTFSNDSVGTVPSGSAAFVSDKVLAAAFGYTTAIPAGTTAFIKDSILVGTGQVWPYEVAFATYINDTGEGAVTSGSNTPQVMTPGVLSTPSGGATFVGQSPLIGVIGAFTAPEVSLLILGDSIFWGSGDSISSGRNGTTGGMAVRAAWGVGGRNIPWTNFAVSGMLATGIASALTKRLAMAPYATHLVHNAGTNDINLTSTVAETLAACETIWSSFKTAGVLHVEQALIVPRLSAISASDATLAGQTVAANFGVSGLREQLNTALTADVGTHSLNAIIDLNTNALQDGTQTDHWAVDDVTPKYMTSDGVHPHGVGQTTGAAILAARYATYVAGQPGV